MSYWAPSDISSARTSINAAMGFDGYSAEPVIPEHYRSPQERPVKYEALGKPRSIVGSLHQAAFLPQEIQGAAYKNLIRKQSLEARPRRRQENGHVGRSISMSSIATPISDDVNINTDLTIDPYMISKPVRIQTGNPFAAPRGSSTIPRQQGSSLYRSVSVPESAASSNRHSGIVQTPSIAATRGQQGQATYYSAEAYIPTVPQSAFFPDQHSSKASQYPFVSPHQPPLLQMPSFASPDPSAVSSDMYSAMTPSAGPTKIIAL